MATYLFAWNPKLWDWPELERQGARAARRGFVDVEWSSGRTRQIEPGSRAFLVRLGVPPKGIIGSGHVITAPWAGPHWLPERAAAGAVTHYLDLRLECLLRMPVVTFDDLAKPPFTRYRWGIRQSGAYLPESLADALEDLWEARLPAARRSADERKRPRKRK